MECYFIDHEELFSPVTGNNDSASMRVTKHHCRDCAIADMRKTHSKRFPFGVRGNVETSGAIENGSYTIVSRVDMEGAEIHNRVMSVRKLYISETKPF